MAGQPLADPDRSVAKLLCGDLCLEMWADVAIADAQTARTRRPVDCSIEMRSAPRWQPGAESLACSVALTARRRGDDAERPGLHDVVDLELIRAPERSAGWRATYAWHSTEPRVPQTPVLAARDDGRVEVLVPFGDETRLGFRGHLRFVLQA